MVIYRPNSETRRVWRDWKSPVKSRAIFIAAHRVRSDLTPAEHSARIDVWVAPHVVGTDLAAATRLAGAFHCKRTGLREKVLRQPGRRPRGNLIIIPDQARRACLFVDSRRACGLNTPSVSFSFPDVLTYALEVCCGARRCSSRLLKASARSSANGLSGQRGGDNALGLPARSIERITRSSRRCAG
jgi:hypothetical protein